MEGAPPTTTTSGGIGGPAPFLLKTYDMVDDSSTDEIVSWSSNMTSFVVWNPPEFARILLPTYFKHNNFSSFIRQLNTYGFRKIDPEKWEFANEDFVKDQKHLLKNIHRRKPIHSHSHPQPQGSTVDPERAAFEEEIDRLSREKASVEANLLRFKHQQSTAKLQLEDLNQRLNTVMQKQENLLSFLNKAAQNPDFVNQLAKKIESMDFSAYNKKRRLPRADHSQSQLFPDNNSIFHQDFSHKLSLELSPAVSDMNLVSNSTQSSNEGGGGGGGGSGSSHSMKTRALLFAPEPQELSDTGTSFGLKMDSSLSHKHLLQQNLGANEEGESNISCQLNLTLASSSPLQVEKFQYSAQLPQLDHEIGGNDADFRALSKNKAHSDGDATNNQVGTTPARVNDGFWERFLTERPGTSDTEEACSSLREYPYDKQEEDGTFDGISRNSRSADPLILK